MGGQSQTEAKLDTSGDVGPFRTCGTAPAYWRWGALSPFAQGYVEALLREVGAAFHMLAPETLARIIADCEAFPANQRAYGAAVGRAFWNNRQAKLQRGFPPLTVSLNDAGKVVFS